VTGRDFCRAWRCTSEAPADDSWQSAGFDDSAWPNAAFGGRNGTPPWGHRDGLDIPGNGRMRIPGGRAFSLSP
jgi:hypothetical protein